MRKWPSFVVLHKPLDFNCYRDVKEESQHEESTSRQKATFLHPLYDPEILGPPESHHRFIRGHLRVFHTPSLQKQVSNRRQTRSRTRKDNEIEFLCRAITHPFLVSGKPLEYCIMKKYDYK